MEDFPAAEGLSRLSLQAYGYLMLSPPFHVQDTLDSLGCGDNVEVKAVPKGDTGDVTAAASAADMATPKAEQLEIPKVKGTWGEYTLWLV